MSVPNPNSNQVTVSATPVTATKKKSISTFYKVKPEFTVDNVGDTESGVMELNKLYDLTPLEHEYIEEKNEEYGVLTPLEGAQQVAEKILENENKQIDPEQFRKLVSKIVDGNGVIERETLELAQKLQAEKPPMEFSELVSKIMAQDTEILANNIAIVQEWNEKQEKLRDDRQVILATALIRYRLDPENQWDINDTKNALKDQSLSYKLVIKLAEYAENERNHWENNILDEEEMKEEIKKRLSETKNQDQ